MERGHRLVTNEETRISLKRDGHVLLIGLDRPAKLNAVDRLMVDRLAQAYDLLAEDEHLRVGVLFSSSEHFCAGLDLDDLAPVLASEGPQVLAGSGSFDPLGLWKPPVPKPVVMAVGGIAFTLSIELALASDVVIAADDVRFCQLEVARGLFPFEGGAFRAPAQLGWGNAMRFLLTAEEFGAAEALRIGLVQEVVSPGRVVDRAKEIAGAIAQKAPLGVQAALAVARAARSAAEATGTGAIADVLPSIWRSDDAQEGLRSFSERRRASFSGR